MTILRTPAVDQNQLCYLSRLLRIYWAWGMNEVLKTQRSQAYTVQALMGVTDSYRSLMMIVDLAIMQLRSGNVPIGSLRLEPSFYDALVTLLRRPLSESDMDYGGGNVVWQEVGKPLEDGRPEMLKLFEECATVDTDNKPVPALPSSSKPPSMMN